MRIRKPVLPSGWYPTQPAIIEDFIKKVQEKIQSEPSFLRKAQACIVPHAGWTFSGAIALSALLRLHPDPQTLIVFGGHLGPSNQPLMLMDDGVETPLGIMSVDTGLRTIILEKIPCRADIYQDNTVEVQLPFLHYLFPESEIIWMRLPAKLESYTIGKQISEIIHSQHKSVRVIGSTDLTHYGPNYDFTPQGIGEKAYQWVTRVNDAEFIAAVLSMDSKEVLRKATEDYAACSVGAVLGTMGYCDGSSLEKPELITYGTSREIYSSDSFVGYASFIWK
jgi:hypothetical protein